MTLKTIFFSLSILSSTVLSADPFVYLTDMFGAVHQIDLATNTASASVFLPLIPTVMALTPDEKKAYIASDSGIIPFDLITNTPGTAIEASLNFNSLAITPDGAYAYAATTGTAMVYVIDLATDSVATTIPLPSAGVFPPYITISPDGTRAYVGVTNGIARINTSTNTVETTLSFPGSFFAVLTFNADGSTLYAVDVVGQVFPIAMPNETIGTPIPTSFDSFFMAISPDGTMGYVSSTSNNVVAPIDLTTNTPILPHIPVGVSPYGLYINSDGTLLYVATQEGIWVFSIPDNSLVDIITSGTFGSLFWFGTPPLSITTDLTGTLTLNTFLNRTDVILIVPVPTDTFTGNNAAYILYNNGVAVASSPVSSTALFVLPTNFVSTSAVLTISAISSNGTVNGSVSVTIS